MITLKKSFEFQNYLKTLLDATTGYFAFKDNITTTTQEHCRAKFYEKAEDEKLTKPKVNEYEFEPNQVICFAEVLLNEIEKLTYAINVAKHSGDRDFDGMIAVNNRKRVLLDRYEEMAKIKSSERTINGYAEKFNVSDEQVQYRYDIKEVTSIDFDRNVVKAKIKQLRKETDDASAAIDMMQLTTMVDYEPIFNIGDSFEDAVVSVTEVTNS